jgi:predicted RNA-binding Zn-ribbon protein involved in translation (DUF1610 family)
MERKVKYKCPKCNDRMCRTTKDYEKAFKCSDCRLVIKTKDYKN